MSGDRAPGVRASPAAAGIPPGFAALLASAAAAACLAVMLAAPSAAHATTVRVAAPGAASGEGYRAAAKRRPCSSQNTIAFSGLLLFRVRHFGGIRCSVPTRTSCRAVLLRDRGGSLERVSTVRDRGPDRCSMASRLAESGRYSSGADFVERFDYRLRLRRKNLRWAGTTRFCPKRRDDGRTLICAGRHSTRAPLRSTVRH